MMMMTLRKSALRPLLSVSVPWSITCSRMLKMSGCAFSISSSSSTAYGCLVIGFGQQAALVEADVARRRADQARHRVPLHVLGHVEADQLDAHDVGELARDLGLADAGRAGEQEAADRLFAACRGPMRAILIAAASASIALSWPNTTLFRSRSRFCSVLRSSLDTLRGGMRAILATISSISRLPMIFLLLATSAGCAARRRPRRSRRSPCPAGGGR